MSAKSSTGTVFLVGAGPGDPGLLTRRAARSLRRADIVIHDALIGGEILDMIRPGAEIIDAGKRCGGRRTSQATINRMLIEAAGRARTVVRLKGGDPFVFGRGGEEALALRAAGIRYRIVPGVTAAVGASAYAGIPLTHRDLSSAVTFVTGHEDPTRSDSHVDWDALARSGATLAIYMGVGKLPAIAERLAAAGMDPSTPAAVIEWGTVPRQRTVTAALDSIAGVAAEAEISAPALVVVGEVTRLRDDLAWFDGQHLCGCRVVVARSRPQPSRIAAGLRKLGADVVEYPRLRAEALDLSPEDLTRVARAGEYDWVLFSSPAGVREFWRQMEVAGVDARALAGARIASLGAATSAALRRLGIRPDVAARTFDVDVVADLLGARDGTELRVLFPREDNLGSAIAEDLRERGVTVDGVGLYRTVVDARGIEIDLEDADFVVLPSSTAARTLQAGLGERQTRATVVAIGPETARVAVASGLPVHAQAAEPTFEGVIQTVRELADRPRERPAAVVTEPAVLAAL